MVEAGNELEAILKQIQLYVGLVGEDDGIFKGAEIDAKCHICVGSGQVFLKVSQKVIVIFKKKFPVMAIYFFFLF